jgi:hypothetical protein
VGDPEHDREPLPQAEDPIAESALSPAVRTADLPATRFDEMLRGEAGGIPLVKRVLTEARAILQRDMAKLVTNKPPEVNHELG